MTIMGQTHVCLYCIVLHCTLLSSYCYKYMDVASCKPSQFTLFASLLHLISSLSLPIYNTLSARCSNYQREIDASILIFISCFCFTFCPYFSVSVFHVHVVFASRALLPFSPLFRL